MDAILNILLSYKGIRFITMLLLFAAGMAYCRVVTGVGLSDLLSAGPALPSSSGDSPVSGLASKLRTLIGNATATGDSNPVYEEIALTGGDGRGTVSEILAQETERTLREGETVRDDFLSGMEPDGEVPAPAQGSSNDIFDGFSVGDDYH